MIIGIFSKLSASIFNDSQDILIPCRSGGRSKNLGGKMTASCLFLQISISAAVLFLTLAKFGGATSAVPLTPVLPALHLRTTYLIFVGFWQL